jgi:arsenate reductase
MHFGYLITVCENAEEQCPIFPGVGQRMYWPFEDPLAFEGTEEEKLAKFRQVRDQIDQRIRNWLKNGGRDE